jgi:sulfite exporter TauE/SafE
MTFLSALILGLLASAHCAAMCGGLQGALQQPLVMRSRRDGMWHLLMLNAGRILTYVLAGVMLSFIGAKVVLQFDIPSITQALRYLAAFVLIALGLQLLLSKSKPFRWIEKHGAAVWQFVQRYMPQQNQSKLRHSLMRGLIWGFLPCGLIYGVLVSTLFLPNTLDAAAVMLGFGVGTLPAMLLTGGMYQAFRSFIRNRAVQTLGGLVFIQGGVFIIFAPWFISTEFMGAYPEIMATMFCRV